MLITKKLTIDLVNPDLQESIYAVQCDCCTRAVEVSLMADGMPWEPPAGAAVSVAFRKPDENKGWYDQLPDGGSACTVAGNVVTAILAPEMLTAPGLVKMFIVFQDAHLNQISTFGLTVVVEANSAAGNVISNSYYKYSTMESVNASMETYDKLIAELEQAKANGEFKGEKGDKGDKGDPGEQGPQGIQGEKGEAPDAVLYTEQTLTPEQQAQARENIGAADDTQMQDIRLGADGITYANAGEAVRTQLGKLFSQSDIVHLKLVQGAYNTADGAVTFKASTKRLSTPDGEFCVFPRNITLSVADGYHYLVYQYNPETLTLTKWYNWNTESAEFPSGYAYKFMLAKVATETEDYPDIVESEAGNILCVCESELSSQLDGNVTKLNKRIDGLYDYTGVVQLNLVQGQYKNISGVWTFTKSTGKISTPEDEYCIFPGKITISVKEGFQFHVVQFNADTLEIIKDYGWSTESAEFPSGYAYKFMLSREGQVGDLSESEAGNILCICESELSNQLDAVQADMNDANINIEEMYKRIDKLHHYTGTICLTLTSGAYHNNGANNITYTPNHEKRLATPEDEYCVFPSNIKVSSESGYHYYVLQYNAETHELVAAYNWNTKQKEFPSGYAYKFMLAKVATETETYPPIDESEKYNINCILETNPNYDDDVSKENTYTEEQKDIIRKVLRDKDRKTVTAVVLADTHYGTETSYGIQVIDHLDILNSIALKTGASFVVHLGDVIRQEATKEKNLANLADYWSAQNNTSVPVLYTLAHHEQYGALGVSAWGNDDTACTREECLGMYGHTTKHLNTVWSDNGANWYVDIKGVRFIGLDITDGGAAVFSDATRAFLSDAVSSAEKVVVFSHCPPRGGVNCYDGTVTNGQAVEALLNDSGKALAYIHGHTHWDNLFKPADGTFPYVSMCSAVPYPIEEETFCSEGAPTVYERVIGEYSEYCFDVFNFHTDTGEIKSFRFGAGSDRAYTPE